MRCGGTDLFDAQYGAGRAFDLVGDHGAARSHFERAIKLAPDDARDQALSAMGISYAFEARADDAARYYQRVFDAQIQADDRPNASATANAIGRIYLESGNLRKAEQWYRTGYETGKKVSQQSAAALALVEMRWRNAMGRLAARRGDRKAALAHARERRRSSMLAESTTPETVIPVPAGVHRVLLARLPRRCLGARARRSGRVSSFWDYRSGV